MTTSIQSYFAGEHAETTAILLSCAIFLASAMALFLFQKDDFSKGFLATSLFGLIVFGGASALLLHRDRPHERSLISSVMDGTDAGSLPSEADRIRVIISKYKYYRWCAVALTLLASLITLLVRNAFWTGLAAGLVILAATQMIVDHYSEHRARLYFSELQALRR